MDSKVIFLSSLVSHEDFSQLSGASLCFGHFNVIHPGHVRYFRTAKRYGNQLVVGLESDVQLSEMEQTKIFSETDRAQALAAVDVVDYVVILDSGRIEDLVQIINPRALVLGKEFERERSFRVEKAVRLVQEQQGEVVYEAGETHYATVELLHGSRSELEQNKKVKFLEILKVQGLDFHKIVEKFEEGTTPRLLVLGDTILDRYIACDPIGMSNEAPVVVVRELETKDYIGGAAIVSAHVSALGGDCKFLSVTGKDNHAELVASELSKCGVEALMIEDASRPTTFKIRYLVENQKLFRVSRLREHNLPKRVEERLIKHILDLAPDLDAIIVCDFVYGVITPKVIEVLGRACRQHNLLIFGDLQCSSQIGNISKFKDFTLLCPTEREARIALGNQDDGVEYVANLLMKQTRSSNLVVKLGSEGFIAYDLDKRSNFLHRQHFPALSVSPVDVTGAGDALLACLSTALSRGLPLMEASALGSCISALAVQTVGNIPVDLNDVKQFMD